MKHTVLVTNDDGIEAKGIVELVQGLVDAGYPVVVCAPDRERSASTMHLTLHRLLHLRRRDDLLSLYRLKEGGPELHLFDVSGYPADSVLLALGGGLPAGTPTPAVCLSGINRGPNMSVDVLHSGTIGAARQAGTCGLPAIATSIDSYEPINFDVAVTATLELLERVCNIIPNVPANLGRVHGSSFPPLGENGDDVLRNALVKGDVYLNLNVPLGWDGDFASTHLGGRWYRDHITIVSDEGDSQWKIKLGSAHIEDEPLCHGDSHCVNLGKASVSTLGTWPQGHPLSVSDEVLAATITDAGLPPWVGDD